MKKRVFISVMLLLAYSLGFAHNLIPHTHINETAEEIVTHDENRHHHYHYNNYHHKKHVNHEHILHGDHFDENLYDLLVCFLHTTDDKQAKDCNGQFYMPTTKKRIINNVPQVQLLAIIISIVPGLEITFTNEFYEWVETLHSLPPINSTSLRGPPSFFC